MVAVKTWFLEKNNLKGLYGKALTVVNETAKAVNVRVNLAGAVTTQWIPKSVLCDEWEKDTSALGYHSYLVDVYHKAYESGEIENSVIRSGRNTYRGDNFIHQLRTAELTEALRKHNINYMTRTEWENR